MKTFATFALLVGAGWASRALGLWNPERVALAGPTALFFAGGFAVIVGTLAYRFWRLNEKSAHYFRVSTDGTLWEGEAHFLGSSRWRVAIGENEGEAFDLGPTAQYLIWIGLALVVGLGTVDARAVGLLGRFERGLTEKSSAYCPDPEAEAAPAQDPNAPGCALIRRAYALGYAKDLGECGAQRMKTTRICTLRQRDEPFLHYAWRLWDGAWGKLRQGTDPEYWRSLKKDFEQRFAVIDQLGAARRQILASAPHAAHHIWTNLPKPDAEAFRPESCGDRYRSMAHRPPAGPPELRASRVFEHVMGQLLFESSYEPAAGSCREYHVHWGATKDSCAQLAANPEGFLKSWGAWDDVQATLQRQRLVKELDALAAADPGRSGASPPQKSQRQLEPSEFVTFQCYVEGDRVGRTSMPFKLGADAFTAEEEAVLPSPSDATVFVDRYAAVASMLAPGFHYGALMSEAGLEQGTVDASLEPAFSGQDLLLSRLNGLAALDLYLGPGWLARRPDLLEVYPYELHLRNYVQVFRRQYLRNRGRL